MDAAVRLVSCRKSQTLAVLMRGLEQEEDWNRKRARELAASSQDLKLGY
jgi:hypothetical protein